MMDQRDNYDKFQFELALSEDAGPVNDEQKLSPIGFPAYHPFRLDTVLCYACFYSEI